MNIKTLQLLTSWTSRTVMILRLQQARFNIGDTKALDKSLQGRVQQKSNDMLESQLEFLVRGRMVDMGVGRGRKIESRDTNAELIAAKSNTRRRKPKRWYSRAYFGRINDLQGILGYELMESAINTVKDPLKEV